MHSRVLALDFGKRRIGLAVSDPLGITAQGLPTLQRTRVRDDVRALVSVTAEYHVGLILMGDPIHMSGDPSRQSGHAREFGERLSAAAQVPIAYWDERWTSVQAGRVLRESGISIEKRARAVDQLSAVLLLESYLDSLAHGAAGEMPS